MQTTELLTVTVKVTWDEIRGGVPESCSDCAVALAIDKLLREPWYASVEYEGVRIQKTSDDLGIVGFADSFPLPLAAVAFTEAFDDPDKSVGPIQFPLELPADVLNEQAKAAAK